MIIPYNNCTHIEMSESALLHNIIYYKQLIGAHNTLALVIKSNAYGHGLIDIAHIVQKNNLAEWLCVAHYQEAVQLRESDITKNILILNYAHINENAPFYENIQFMVDSIEYALYLNERAKRHKQQLFIHIKIDTGLSRLGIQPETLLSFIKKVKKLSHLKITGIFSHFIASDSNQEVTQQQFSLFCNAITSVLSEHPSIQHIHMSNTGSLGTLHYPSFCSMFRVGLGIYGFGHNYEHLQPVLTWKTRIMNIKTVPAHSFVSYACTYKTTRTTRIALLPIGYSDGYQLRFSNKTHVLINNVLAPVIGRVGMNMTMVDVTDCPASIGDEVILIGDNEGVRLMDIAETSEIYNVREILTSIHPSIIRVTML